MSESALEPRRVFVSYSHDSEEHKAWVLQLATRLVHNGINIILDRWDTVLGSDLAGFMETGLTTADRILVISSAKYVVKANTPTGGAGYEKRIMTAQILGDLTSTKVVPVIRNNDVEPLVPTFLGGAKYVDFRDDTNYEDRYAELLYDLYGQQLLPRPELGPNPFAQMKLEEIPQQLSMDPARYESPASQGRITFDYLNNNGRYTIGTGVKSFTLSFTEAGYGSIHAYSDGANTKSIAVAPQTPLNEIRDPGSYDSSSRHRTVHVGDTIVIRNDHGNFAYVGVEEVIPRDPATGAASLTLVYAIP